jgi:hypothetical protein
MSRLKFVLYLDRFIKALEKYRDTLKASMADTIEVGFVNGDRTKLFMMFPMNACEPIQKPLSLQVGIVSQIDRDQVPWLIQELQSHLDGKYDEKPAVDEARFSPR